MLKFTKPGRAIKNIYKFPKRLYRYIRNRYNPDLFIGRNMLYKSINPPSIQQWITKQPIAHKLIYGGRYMKAITKQVRGGSTWEILKSLY